MSAAMAPAAGSPARHYKLAVIPGDGIGPEVIAAGVAALEALAAALGGFAVSCTHLDWSSATYARRGHYIPADGLATLRAHDAILFGAVGDPSVAADHESLWGLRLAICQPLQQWANVRPTRILRGLASPLAGCARGDLDWVIVRENSEGEYAGQGGRSHVGHGWEVATEVAVFTRHGVRRVMRFAFETARSRPRRQLVVVTKSNAQRYGLVLWDEVAAEVAADFPDVRWERVLVDAMAARMVLDPRSVDTVVATNLHADILSDLAAALAGSIGVAPTSNLDPSRANPSMFEPIHGSALDIAGQGVANPVGTFWTVAEMLRFLDEGPAADALMECVENVCEAGVKTRDLGGHAGTDEVTAAVCAEIEKLAAARGRAAA